MDFLARKAVGVGAGLSATGRNQVPEGIVAILVRPRQDRQGVLEK